MTPRDVGDMAHGYAWRERRDWQRMAWIVASVIGPHVKRIPPALSRLANTGPDVAEKVIKRDATTPEEARAFVAELGRAHKAKAWTLLKDDVLDGDKDKQA
jgi:hypothetical protein